MKKILLILTIVLTTSFVFGHGVYAVSEAVKNFNTTAVGGFTDEIVTEATFSEEFGYMTAEFELEKEGIITSIPLGIGKIIGAGLSFLGIIFLALMIFAGFTWMLARGNEQDVTKAKDLIRAAVIGLVIVLSAYAITSYLGNSLI